MTTFPHIQFDDQEQSFIDRVMKGWKPANYDVYLDMLLAILDNQLDRNKYMVTNTVLAIAEGIRFKVYDYRASVEIERMISEPISPPSLVYLHKKNATKAASYHTSSTFSFNTKHKKIVDMLKASPGMSRRELSVGAGILLQTVCGLVHSLIAHDLVKVVGTKFDEKTERTVEILEVVE